MIVVSFFLGSTIFASFLIYGSAFYSLTAAIFVFISYIILKFRSPHLDRPFNISNGPIAFLIPILGLILTSFAISGCFLSNPNNTIVFYILMIQVIVSVIYYIFFVRHRLVLSAEQKFIKMRICKIKEETLRKHQIDQIKGRLDVRSRVVENHAQGVRNNGVKSENLSSKRDSHLIK
ncbi:hypothetical protein BC833DRAFT_147230 [Globomyces pollinis-pini]|nr:hypothetical protein BC833DRAFT_147230 [Globomyces pollinis-pini]